MKNLFNRFVREEQGQDLIEYALLAGLISLASIVAITRSARRLQGHYNTVGAAVTARPRSREVPWRAHVCPAALFHRAVVQTENRRPWASVLKLRQRGFE